MNRKNSIASDILKTFESVPDLYLIFSPDLHILTASNAYLADTRTVREDLVGKHISQVFAGPFDPLQEKAATTLYASLKEVMATGKPHQVTLPHYSIHRSSPPRSSSEEKYRYCVNTPVLDEQGNMLYIIHKISDASRQASNGQPIPTQTAQEPPALIDAGWQWSRLQAFFMQAPVAIGIYTGKEHMVELVNPKMCEIMGRPAEELLGKTIFEALPEIIGQGFEAIFSEVFSTGIPFEIKEAPVSLLRKGEMIPGFYHTIYQPLKNTQGEITGIINIANEVTQQVMDRQALKKLNHELETHIDIRTEELKAARVEAEAERNQIHRLLMQAPAMITVFKGPEHTFHLVNPLYQQLVGERELVGKPIREAMPELEGQPIFSLLDKVYQTGETFYAHEMLVQLDHTNSGMLGNNYYNFVYQATRDLQGHIDGILVFAYEVTVLVKAREKLQKSEEHLQRLNGELEATNEKISAINEELVKAKNELEQLNSELEGRVAARTWELEVAQAETNRHRERLERFFMQAPAGIVILDGPDLVFQLVNPAYQQIFSGRTLLGKPLLEALPELEGSPIIDTLRQVYQTGETFVAQEFPMMLARHQSSSLEEIFWTFTYQARYNEQGQVDGILAFAYEVTEQVLSRRKVEASEKQLRLITDSLPVLIGYLDKEERYRFANQAYKAWFNQSPELLLGRHIREVVGEKAYQGVKEYIDRALAGERLDFEARMPYRENFVKYIRTSYVPNVQNEEVTGFYTLVNDITEQTEARQKVEESAERFRTLLESIPQITWTALPTGEINFYNERWYSYTGLNYEQSKAWGWKVVIHPDDLPATMSIYEHALSSGEAFELECRLKFHTDGKYRWHLSRTLPLRNEQGILTGWVGTATDIHEQKLTEQQLLESGQYFRMMANNAPVMIWVTRPDGYCTYLNKPWYDYTGQTEHEAADLGWTQATHPEDVEMASRAFIEATEKRGEFRINYRLRRKDGTYRWFTDVGLPRFNQAGEFEGHIGAVLDIHEQKLAEEALQMSTQKLAKANKELEAANQEIQASNRELSISNQQLIYMNADLDNFIYTASHDLKAPIVNIEGLIKILIRHLSKESREDERTQMTINHIQGSIERFKRTIFSLTEVVKLQKEYSQPVTWLDLDKVLKEVELDLATAIAEAKAVIKADTSQCPLVQFSEKNLRSILYNLLSNAIKYRSPERRLEVYIHCEQNKEYQILTVQDNGLGMNLSGDQKLFTMFRRLHTHVDGSGIGLYMVKRIVDNAGGKIEVESKVGEGSTFKIYFKR